MPKYEDHEVSGAILSLGYPLKQIIRVAKSLQESRKVELTEADADYEMGRGPMPKGYLKRRGR